MARIETFTQIYNIEYIDGVTTRDIKITAGSVEEAIEIFRKGYNNSIVGCCLYIKEVLCDINMK